MNACIIPIIYPLSTVYSLTPELHSDLLLLLLLCCLFLYAAFKECQCNWNRRICLFRSQHCDCMHNAHKHTQIWYIVCVRACLCTRVIQCLCEHIQWQRPTSNLFYIQTIKSWHNERVEGTRSKMSIMADANHHP